MQAQCPKTHGNRKHQPDCYIPAYKPVPRQPYGNTTPNGAKPKPKQSGLPQQKSCSGPCKSHM
ncbi:hypothetical protein AA18889_1310 [Acetobacter senegalensis DSM 18889]|nr:hypothetical protein AA18889_1310 [Acetobacter senegalensis DSM 18889]